MKAFNLNSNIKVKLKTDGYQRLADLHNSFLHKIPNWEVRDAAYYERKADANGYSKFQGWSFIHDFGPTITLGIDPMFHLDILIEDEDLTEIKLPQ